MTELHFLTGGNLQMIAYDQVAHGMTFADPNPIRGDEDATPHGEDLSKVVHFSDAIHRDDFDLELIDDLVPIATSSHAHQLFPQVIFVTCGGTGARIAFDYITSSSRKFSVKGVVFVSPYLIETRGVPSVLRSVASASVGRALVVSMAKSEITQVIPRRSWEARDIPTEIQDAYHKTAEIPEWEDSILSYLRRPIEVPFHPPRLACKSLVIKGEFDHWVTSDHEYEKFASAIGCHIPVATIQKSGSWPQEEQPATLASLIYQFVISS
jgi:pimeloyl-ACP methyl ester carboxylesterase